MKKQILGLLLALLPVTGMAAQECSITAGKSVPNVRYQFNDIGTVKDRISGLTWMRCPLGKTWNNTSQICEGEGSTVFWQAALNDVQAINSSESHELYHFGGKSKWRLPNIKELASLTEHGCRAPSLNGKAFNGAFPYQTSDGSLKAYIWSNTPNHDGSKVLTYDTVNGEIYERGVSEIAISVLLVSDE
ncbi:DUF1566 domain-containing protein [Photobacterium sp. OFAV2-7]|uniref:Lcl C-terminal domain-containing protein n=1 Tax=Photobacterium sp. OFAV2-7 TaxID=2917748 RepID=UPI001EF3F090|nr:DUF1566 domain-containing protein [Photobacterium sp. OFAV2-7]MCG7586565.1 DUF1566 domain-containing protein [Photobacterium sp. OFAV2-7]